MTIKASTSNPLDKRARKRVTAACGLILIVSVLALWATADREWERTWKDRTRVETPLGSDKDYVLSWIGRNLEFHPFMDTSCQDAIQGISVMTLAGINKAAVASFARVDVFRKDILAGEHDHMKIYYFFDANDKVVGHYHLPFHELASFEKSYQLLASR